MLGCHEFCGYYEWTFHYVRRRWGQAGVERRGAPALRNESQRHYIEAAQQDGLAGLYRTWVKTGEDESCDWTFTLDEAHNVLRCDMRQCPSKGFLLAHDLNADEDYCDHCVGWMMPLLDQVGVEVWQHEHNHCGQCWTTMRAKDRPSKPLELEIDIRRDPRWNCGSLDRWEHNRKQPLLPDAGHATDPCDALAGWFTGADRLVVIGEGEDAGPASGSLRGGAGLMAGRAYLARGDLGLHPLGVLVESEGTDLESLSERLLHTPAARRPVLLHAYLPRSPMLDFVGHGLPRPLPILPLLIRTGKYVHQPGGREPSPKALLAALAEALGK